MASIESLTVYSLAGAQGVEVEATRRSIRSGGLENDRTFLLYDPNDRNDSVYARVSARQQPDLLQVKTQDAGYAQLPDGTFLSRSDLEFDELHTVGIDEFGDITHGHDLGDKASEFFSDFLNTEVRLAYVGKNRDRIPPQNRKVAPLHIVTSSSIEWVVDETGLDYSEIVRRFRPNIVIRSDNEPFSELKWTSFAVGHLSQRVVIKNPTARCMVPGLDSHTGQNNKDIPKLYPDMPKIEIDGKQKPAFGVYGYIPKNIGLICVGDLIEPTTEK